jgi:hypothetical protein
MKRVSLGMVLGVALATAVGVHSFVYACDHAARTIEVTEISKVQAPAPSLTVDVEFPLDQLRLQHVSMICTRAVVCDELKDTPAQSVRKTARVAATLGRALVTTVGAVMGSLFDAAVEATASLV